MSRLHEESLQDALDRAKAAEVVDGWALVTTNVRSLPPAGETVLLRYWNKHNQHKQIVAASVVMHVIAIGFATPACWMLNDGGHRMFTRRQEWHPIPAGGVDVGVLESDLHEEMNPEGGEE